MLAMAHHRLGHAEQDRKWLAKAEEWYDRTTEERVAAEPFQIPLEPWWDTAEFQILHREAKALIEGSVQDDPNLKALRARGLKELERRNKAAPHQGSRGKDLDKR